MLINFLLLFSYVSSHILDSFLKNFQTLHKDEIFIKFIDQNAFVSLNIDNQSYSASLVPHKELFHKHFSAVVIENDQYTELKNSTDGHYLGAFDNANNSRVVLHIHDGILTGNILLNNELFYIEPSWRHINYSHGYHMILYKKSDLKYNFGNPKTGEFCGHNHSDFSVPSTYTQGTSFSYDIRFKRGAAKKNTCDVILVADYKFYKEIGARSEIITKSFLVTIFERIYQIFEQTEFLASSSSFSGYSMQIKKILIHKSASSDPNNYNYEKSWKVSDMLDSFGYGNSEAGADSWTDYCLAHLFTNRDFDKGVLGLAYVASPISNKIGGICSPSYLTGLGRYRMLNIGLSTSINYGRHLLSSELEIVTAHEIGHNWGSSHDPDNNDDCAPRDNRFIMYPSAVDGSDVNNRRFSPCSRYSIGSVLKYKAGCFVERTTTICGNGILEEGEDCDSGNKADPCCTSSCKFKPGAVCSDLNSLCCSNCRFAGPSNVCYESNNKLLDVLNSCVARKKCSATSTACDQVEYEADRTECFDNGTCISGKCLDFCASKGYTLCRETGANVCKWTCAGPDGACDKVFSELPNGKPCPNGACYNGKCLVEPQAQKKLWNIISNLTASAFLIWMKNNIVLIVIVFTSIFWVPLSMFVSWLDRGHDEVDYHTMTLETKRKSILRTQKSTVSSKSFELKPIREDNIPILGLTGEPI